MPAPGVFFLIIQLYIFFNLDDDEKIKDVEMMYMLKKKQALDFYWVQTANRLRSYFKGSNYNVLLV